MTSIPSAAGRDRNAPEVCTWIRAGATSSNPAVIARREAPFGSVATLADFTDAITSLRLQPLTCLLDSVNTVENTLDEMLFSGVSLNLKLLEAEESLLMLGYEPLGHFRLLFVSFLLLQCSNPP